MLLPSEHLGGAGDHSVAPETPSTGVIDAFANLNVTSQSSFQLARVAQERVLPHVQRSSERSEDTTSAETGVQGNDGEANTPIASLASRASPPHSEVDTTSPVRNQSREPDYSPWSLRNHPGWVEDSLLSGIFHPTQQSNTSSDTMTDHQAGMNFLIASKLRITDQISSQ